MVKGLKDIKTMSTVDRKQKGGQPSSKDSSIKIGFGRPAKRTQPSEEQAFKTPEPMVKRKPIKTWVFTEDPEHRQVDGQTLIVRKEKEPEVDISKESNRTEVMAKLEGVEDKDIEVNVEGDILTIEAKGTTSEGLIRYYRELLLPFVADEKKIETKYEDGILELILCRKKKQKKKRN
ncbi:MAG: Hsp20/alpha crystallin family protein [Euryarchaeota archaeon]|nr:Hsp20/alpha crystallin family protein [Euryarchaeota archaeon]